LTRPAVTFRKKQLKRIGHSILIMAQSVCVCGCVCVCVCVCVYVCVANEGAREEDRLINVKQY